MITDEKELVLQFMDLLAGEMLKAKQYSEWHKASWHDAFRFIEGHARYKALVAAFYQNPDLTKKVEPEDNQGWIKWSGGKQPVPDGTKIQVRFRSDYFDAEIYSWSNEACDEDIIAYRIKPNTVKPEDIQPKTDLYGNPLVGAVKPEKKYKCDYCKELPCETPSGETGYCPKCDCKWFFTDEVKRRLASGEARPKTKTTLMPGHLDIPNRFQSDTRQPEKKTLDQWAKSLERPYDATVSYATVLYVIKIISEYLEQR